MDESEIIFWGLGQAGAWIVTGLVGSLIVVWIMGFLTMGQDKAQKIWNTKRNRKSNSGKKIPKKAYGQY